MEPIVVIGGGLLGCETSLYLAQKGKKVTVVEMLDAVADDLYLANRMYLLKLLSDANVKTIIKERALEINSEGIRTINGGGKKNLVAADTIVLAAGLKSNNDLWENLRNKVSEIYAIGDCVKPRRVLNAIWEGFRTARLI